MKVNLSIYLPLLCSAMLMLSCPAVSQDVNPALATKSVLKIETHTFVDVVSVTHTLSRQYGTEKVLVVMDIDNTILTSTTDLGSDVWYQWQTGKLEVKPTSSQKVGCLFEDSIGLLYELSPMTLTEKNLHHIISDWQTSGHTVVGLTSRAPQFRAATERELIRNQVNLATSALVPLGQNTMMFREIKGREISYMLGIMMTSGLNKAEMLDHLLNKAHRDFEAIVFVDDAKKNIDNIFDAYQNVKDIDMRIFHYTRIEDQREKQFGQVLTQQQANIMAEQWTQLNTKLQQIFPARNLSHGCLTP